jgi:hypothetical protein
MLRSEVHLNKLVLIGGIMKSHKSVFNLSPQASHLLLDTFT